MDEDSREEARRVVEHERRAVVDVVMNEITLS
jgi:hypothetical protein